mgnify:CR=1 FL=1
MRGYLDSFHTPKIVFGNQDAKYFIKADLLFYFAILWPFFALIIYDLTFINLVPITYLAGLMLLALTLYDRYLYKPLELMMLIGITYSVILIGIKIIIGSYDFLNIIKIFSSIGIAAYFIKFPIKGFRSFAIFASILVFVSFYLMGFLYGIVGGNAGIGFSYHDSGIFILILWSMLILKSNRDFSLYINLFFLFLVLFLTGRTQIIIGMYIFLFALWPIFKKQDVLGKFSLILFLFPTIAGIIFFPSQILDALSNFYFLNDIISRGIDITFDADGANSFDENLRLFVWNCYIINFDLNTIIYGHNEIINECVSETWEEAYDMPILQYENSFIRMNQESGIAAVLFIFIFIFSIIYSLFKKDLFIAGLIFLFVIRASTGDIFLFYYKDYILLIILTYAFYEKSRVYNQHQLKK